MHWTPPRLDIRCARCLYPVRRMPSISVARHHSYGHMPGGPHCGKRPRAVYYIEPVTAAMLNAALRENFVASPYSGFPDIDPARMSAVVDEVIAGAGL